MKLKNIITFSLLPNIFCVGVHVNIQLTNKAKAGE